MAPWLLRNLKRLKRSRKVARLLRLADDPEAPTMPLPAPAWGLVDQRIAVVRQRMDELDGGSQTDRVKTAPKRQDLSAARRDR